MRRPTPKMNGKVNGNAEEEESEEEEEPEPVSATLVCFRPSTVCLQWFGSTGMT